VTASLLDLPISEVPHFREDPNGWFVRWTLWLQGRGLCVVPLCGRLDIAAFHVAIGLSYGNPHVVIMRNGQVVHDPDPTRDALVLVARTFVLLPVEEVTSKVYPLSGGPRARSSTGQLLAQCPPDYVCDGRTLN
jgi:hypothetical protein